MDDLYDECIRALDGNFRILSQKENREFVIEVEKLFPLMITGLINWDKVINKKELISAHDILHYFEEDEKIIFCWSDGGLPDIETTLKVFLGAVEEITIVSFDTYVFFPNHKCIVEFHHDGKIMMGYSNETIKQ